jgi:hypothetical protein
MSNQSIEDLLNLINDSKKNKESKSSSVRLDKSVQNFIEELKIEPGTQAVPNSLIFYYYRMIWKVDQRKVKKIMFFRSFSQKLPNYRHGQQRFYMIKPNIFDLSKLEEAESYDKTYWSKKETKQKKLSIP